jgi:hypothetical protein
MWVAAESDLRLCKRLQDPVFPTRVVAALGCVPTRALQKSSPLGGIGIFA